MACQLRQGAFECQTQRRMGSWRSRFRARKLAAIVFTGDFSLAQALAARIVARIDQDAEGPGDETRLTAKTADAALHFQKRVLHRVFRIERIAEKVPGEILHARALQRVQTLVGAQVSG